MTEPQSPAQVFRAEILQAKFPPEAIKYRPDGFPYIEDEAIMDHLDKTLGVGNWDVADAEAIDAKNVRITLRVRTEDGDWARYTDFGTATNPNSAETLKEAWTDAFRRVTRIIGVGRYVYAGEVPQRGSAGVSTSPAAPPPPVVAVVTPAPAAPVAAPPQGDTGVCPQHQRPWKQGKFGPYCTAKALPGEQQNDRGYCSLRP